MLRYHRCHHDHPVCWIQWRTPFPGHGYRRMAKLKRNTLSRSITHFLPCSSRNISTHHQIWGNLRSNGHRVTFQSRWYFWCDLAFALLWIMQCVSHVSKRMCDHVERGTIFRFLRPTLSHQRNISGWCCRTFRYVRSLTSFHLFKDGICKTSTIIFLIDIGACVGWCLSFRNNQVCMWFSSDILLMVESCNWNIWKRKWSARTPRTPRNGKL